jgi:hypothetical protein
MIQSGYNPQGGNMLTTSVGAPPPLPGMPGGLPFDPSAAIREKLRREAEQTAFENKLREQDAAMRQKQMAMQEQSFKDSRRYQDRDRARMTNHPAAPKGPDPLDALKAADAYDLSRRGAATRPTGLGAQMIPGMAVDPNLLPSRMRPQGSSFQGSIGPSAAGLTPEPVRPPIPSSNRGFDYADPYSQALVQQSAFGRR